MVGNQPSGPSSIFTKTVVAIKQAHIPVPAYVKLRFLPPEMTLVGTRLKRDYDCYNSPLGPENGI